MIQRHNNGIDYIVQISCYRLDCADCAARVGAVKRIPGVTNATITFPAGRLNVDYDPQQTGITQVIDKIKKLGYEAREEEKIRKYFRSFSNH